MFTYRYTKFLKYAKIEAQIGRQADKADRYLTVTPLQVNNELI